MQSHVGTGTKAEIHVVMPRPDETWQSASWADDVRKAEAVGTWLCELACEWVDGAGRRTLSPRFKSEHIIACSAMPMLCKHLLVFVSGNA